MDFYWIVMWNEEFYNCGNFMDRASQMIQMDVIRRLSFPLRTTKQKCPEGKES